MTFWTLLVVIGVIVTTVVNSTNTTPIENNDNINSNTSPPSFNGKIKHIIALMLENRSFDHMVGFLKQNRTEIDGCIPEMAPNCSNPLTSNQYKTGPFYPVGNNAVYIQPGDPDHSVDGTTLQLYGDNVSNLINTYPAKMDGFIESYNNKENKNEYNDSGKWIMECFPPSTVPIITTLANEFSIYDSWFADFPGCTEPNRLFSWLTTSGGMANNDDEKLAEGFKEMSLFELLDKELIESQNYDEKDTWRLYFEQVATPIFIDYTRRHPLKFHFMDDFWRDVKKGDLPLFSWIDPAYSDLPDFPARDQHPDHDVTEGEKLMKEIYEALRSGPKWNETLFIIFYDEHGGFYDHVSPPLAPNPDNKNSSNPIFNFNRLGLRVPAIFISPWIKKGTIGTKPISSENSQYSHSSIVHTMREQYMPNAEPITKRDEWSLTFEDIINLNEIRNDCPETLPDVPDGYSRLHPSLLIDSNSNLDMKQIGVRDHTWWQPGKQETNDFIRSLVVGASSLCDVKLDDIDQYLVNQEIAGKFLIDCMKQFMGIE